MPLKPRSSSPGPRALPVLPPSPLPPLYARWMHEALSGPLPMEPDATCDQCAMLETAGEALSVGATFFHPQTKCCTFMPELPNFLAGRALADPRASQATVIARMQTKIAVTPFGLGRSQRYRTLYEQHTDAFGQLESMRCPHYVEGVGGNCGLWQHRNASCATWFCKHERGLTGDLFWRAMVQLLSHVEQQLSHWCVLELGVGDTALGLLFRPLGKGGQKIPLEASAPDGTVNEAEYQMLWGTWYGREAAFYQQCAALVNDLTWAEVVARCGPALPAFWQLARVAHATVQSDALPETLRVGEFQLLAPSATGIQAQTYSSYDPLNLSLRLLALLPYFDGRPLATVRQDILAQEQLTLSDSLLRRLVDFGVLVSGD